MRMGYGEIDVSAVVAGTVTSTRRYEALPPMVAAALLAAASAVACSCTA
jgi:hypothetical protein